MDKPSRFRITSRHLFFATLFLGAVLGAIMVAGALGYKLEEKLFTEITNGVMIAAVGVFLYGRKLRAGEVERAEDGEAGKADVNGTGGGTKDGDGK